MKTLALLLSLTACVDLESEDNLADVEQESHSTSVAALPNKIVLARLDDTATSAVLQFSGNRVFANRADSAGTPLLHHYFPNIVSQLIVGDFSLDGSREHGRDQVCARLVDNTLYCYAPSDVDADGNRTELWYWFAQIWPLTASETAIVGDFTGDGADDILAFNSSTGGLRLFDRTITGMFKEQTWFSLGNLASYDLRGKKLYAGEFGQASDRADLLVVDPVSNTVTRFDTVTENGATTFWYAFQSRTNTLAANEQITVANLEGGARDGLLLRNPATGALRAMRLDYGTGYLVQVPSTTLSLGQLPVTANTGTLAAVRLVNHSAEPNGALRDDILFFDSTDNKIVETSARHDGTRMTYWWGWSKTIPAAPTWVMPPSKMAIVFCKTSDNATYEPSKNEVLKRVTGVGTGSIRDYLLEVTYGAIDIKNADVYGWVQGTLAAAKSNARVIQPEPPAAQLPEGYKLADYRDDCLKAAGITSSQYEGRVYVVLNGDDVSSQGDYNGATMEYPEIINGRLYFAAHEMLHAFGLGHADDDSTCGGEYCDTSSVMGNYYPTLFKNTLGYEVPPGMNAVNLDKLGVVPASRIVDLAVPTTSQTRTITVAALERPEANGALYVRIATTGSKYFTVSLRHSVGYDRKVPLGVQIHEADTATRTSKLHTYPSRALQPGDRAFAGGYAVTVSSFDPVKKTATLTLVH